MATKTRNIARRALAAAALLSAAALYFIFDPAISVWAPKCAFKILTGLDCPGCGSQRMLHALLHGDIASAWHANPFLLCLLPALALMAVSAIWRERFPRLYNILNSPPAIIAAAILLLAWTVVRNLCL